MHKLNLGTRIVNGDYVLTFECVCGRVFAKKTAPQQTHAETSEVTDAGVRACLLDADEPEHAAQAHLKCPATAYEQAKLLAAERLEGQEPSLGRVASGAGNTPTIHHSAASLNPS